MEYTGEPSISIYLPTHESWNEKEQDKIRYKNLLRKAEAELMVRGYDEKRTAEILKLANSLLDEEHDDFWRHQSNGLALFINEEDSFYFRLPREFDEEAVVSDTFHIKPLVPLVSRDRQYFVLTLDLSKARLYNGSQYMVSEIELPSDTPTSLEKATALDDPEKSLQFHTSGSPTGPDGERPGQFHGQGVSKDDLHHKKKILRFFQRLNDGVMEIIKDENAPLLLVGVDYLLPMYREANKYPHLLDHTVEHNPQDLTLEKLHEKTWTEVSAHFSNELDEALNEYGNKTPDNLASDNVAEVIKGAVHQRIDKLFIDLSTTKWGRYDEQNDQLVIDPDQKPQNEDLVDYAVRHTIANNGEIFMPAKDRMPNSSDMAAVFRF